MKSFRRQQTRLSKITQVTLSEANKVRVPYSSIRSPIHEFSLAALPLQRREIIIGPNGHPWESKAVFNAAAVLKDGRIYILYRAFGEEDNPIYEGIPERPSSIGLAISKGGLSIDERLSDPVLIDAEDPRITELDGRYFTTYTKTKEPKPPNEWDPDPQPAIAVTTNLRKFKELGLIKIEGLEDVTKNVVLFPRKIKGRYAAFARQKPDIFVIYSDDLIHWDSPEFTMGPRERCWDSEFIGPGAPPIETRYGWLNIYHGVDKAETYRLGVALHDLNDPSIVLARSKDALLEPKECYEIDGINGKPPHHNIVYTCGVIKSNGQLFLYYGAADQALALATVPQEALEKAITRN